MGKPFAWSHSALTSYEQCPKKHWHLKINKDVKEVFGDQTNYGLEVHDALEARLKSRRPLPMGMQHMEPMAASIEAAPGTLYTEQQLALNRDFEPTGYFDSDVWVRGKADVAKVLGGRGVVFDYKTGKRKEEYSQLDLMAALFMHHVPELQNLSAAYIWLKHKDISTKHYTREELPAVWNELLPRVSRLERAVKTDDWPAKQNGLCAKYCPVRSCVHNGANNA